MKRCVFAIFQQELQNSTMFDSLFRKMGEFVVSIEHSEAKSVSASGGLRPPDLPSRGSAPGPRWGRRLRSPDPSTRGSAPGPPL